MRTLPRDYLDDLARARDGALDADHRVDQARGALARAEAQRERAIDELRRLVERAIVRRKAA